MSKLLHSMVDYSLPASPEYGTIIYCAESERQSKTVSFANLKSNCGERNRQHADKMNRADTVLNKMN
jgi:hypothetical protein